MKRWASISLTALLLCGNGLPLQAEGNEQTIHLTVHAAVDPSIPCPDSIYEVTQDSAGKIPYTNGAGEPYHIQCNALGQGELTLPRGNFYLKLHTPAKGYYGSSDVVPISTSLTLSQWQIRFAFSSGERIPQMQLRKEDNQVISCAQAEAGKTYTAFETQGTAYHAAKPVKVTVPFMKDDTNDPIYVSTEDTLYGTAAVRFLDGTNEIAGVKYAVFTDEACTVKAVDMFGAEEEYNSTDKNLVSLNKGTYYLKMEDLPLHYAVKKDGIPFTVEEEKETAVNIPLEIVQLAVQVKDVETEKQVAADVTCVQDSDGKEVTSLERGQTYRIHAVCREPQYFAMEDQKITVDPQTDNKVTVSFPAVPFHMEVEGQDSASHQSVAMKYEIFDENGNIQKDIHAGSKIRFHQTEWDSGYLPAADQEVVIPVYNKEPMTFHVIFQNTPYVVALINAPASTGFAFYQDAACTQQAVDCFDHPAEGSTNAMGVLSMGLLNGTYYVKETRTPEGYRKNGSVQKIVCDKADSSTQKLSFANEHIALNIHSSILDGELHDVIYHIYEGDNEIASIDGTGEDQIDHGLLAGHTYDVVAESTAQYLYEKKQTVTFQEDGEDQEVSFSFRPYVNLYLHTNSKSSVKGALYTDEACSEKCQDVDGSLCDLVLNKEGALCRMAPGIYWFKNEAVSHYYPTITKVDLSSGLPSVHETVDLNSVDITVEILNERNSGHLMELRDEEGNLIRTWNASEEEEEIDAEKLEAGKKYTLLDKETGETTPFAIPSAAPSEKPIVKVQTAEDSLEDTSAKQIPNVFWMVGGAAALLAVAGGGLFLHRRQM